MSDFFPKCIFASLGSSHDFLSMIFGIFGKFGIEIYEQKKIVENFSSENCLIEKENQGKCRKIDRFFASVWARYSKSIPILPQMSPFGWFC